MPKRTSKRRQYGKPIQSGEFGRPREPAVVSITRGGPVFGKEVGPFWIRITTAVRWHHTDMSAAYLKACGVHLPNSQSVIDRFHVAKKLGEVADDLRKKTIEPTSEV
ncbi:transposase [Telmatocola sphagniphila]|uniref:Transposase n=1 Tax=Telmatocola sphagniphila TaxID=1123043 RepID=A0A8E6ETN4_9BACT|nr:transposase [Telmatocola sphagniphila]QVL30325.1 transposase [Telmatocola sphagniphila]